MNEALPLISFCIPTYNRQNYLLKSLDAIVSQLNEASRHAVEILISDNASTDSTVKVVEDFIVEHSGLNIRLFVNDVNAGMDGNFINCYTKARGTFVCLVSDDDFFLPGRVDFLLNAIRANPNLDGIFLNPFTIGGCLEEVEKICNDQDEMLRRVGDRLVHLGAFVFRRDIFLRKSYREYDGTHLVISYIFLDVMRSGKGVLFTKERFFEITQNNSGGYNFFDVFITSYCDLMSYARRIGYSDAAVSIAKMQHLRHFVLPFVVDLRLNDSYIRMARKFGEGFKLIVKHYGIRPIIFWGVIPVLFAPRFFWACVRQLVRGARRVTTA